MSIAERLLDSRSPEDDTIMSSRHVKHQSSSDVRATPYCRTTKTQTETLQKPKIPYYIPKYLYNVNWKHEN